MQFTKRKEGLIKAMKIAIINGSPRKNGATGILLKQIKKEILQNKPDYNVQYYDLSEIEFKNCLGCEKCYQLGHCVIKDGFDDIVNEIKKCDGIIIGSPNHGSNVSAILKNFMDRGHFIVEQALYNKTCFSLITYEIADGNSALNILNKFFIVSGGKLKNKMMVKIGFNKNPLENPGNNKKIIKEVKQFIGNLSTINKKSFFQYIFNDIIVVNIIWGKYFKKHPEQFRGIINIYRENNIHSRITTLDIFNQNSGK
jgi:multimeric flavodoxin WrbA